MLGLNSIIISLHCVVFLDDLSGDHWHFWSEGWSSRVIVLERDVYEWCL